MAATTLANMFGYDVAANRPAAGIPGRHFYASDTDVLSRDNGATWDTLAPGGGGGGGAPTSVPFVTTAADGTLSAEVVIPGLAASADIKGAAGSGTSEEFDSGGSPFTWDNAPAVEDVNTTVKSHLYIKTTGTTVHKGSKAYAPAGAFDVRARLRVGYDSRSGSQDAMLAVWDTATTGGAMLDFSWDASTPQMTVVAFTQVAGTFTNRASVIVSANAPLGDIYLRIVRDGSNNLAWYYSRDGILWINIVAAISFTFTAAKLGFYLAAASATTRHFAIDWLRTA